MYKKILTAQFSPENGCFADDGSILTVVPRKTVPETIASEYHFISIHDSNVTSRYGWVTETEPFSLKAFVRRYKSPEKITEIEINHLQIMFRSISKISNGKPVGAGYSMRGIMNKEMVFTVHKVIFY